MDRSELKECLAEDRKRILGNTQAYHIFFIVVTRHAAWLRWKYVKHMRKAAFYQERFQGGSRLAGIPMMWYLLRKNLIGNKLGFEIGGGTTTIGKGFAIYHNGPVVIHGKSKIGEYCSLHGDNCIGNNGINDECPVIGANVDIGVGAKIIGNVHIADNCKIGAGAIVVSDFLEPGSVVGGVPARKLK